MRLQAMPLQAIDAAGGAAGPLVIGTRQRAKVWNGRLCRAIIERDGQSAHDFG